MIDETSAEIDETSVEIDETSAEIDYPKTNKLSRVFKKKKPLF